MSERQDFAAVFFTRQQIVYRLCKVVFALFSSMAACNSCLYQLIRQSFYWFSSLNSLITPKYLFLTISTYLLCNSDCYLYLFSIYSCRSTIVLLSLPISSFLAVIVVRRQSLSISNSLITLLFSDQTSQKVETACLAKGSASLMKSSLQQVLHLTAALRSTMHIIRSFSRKQKYLKSTSIYSSESVIKSRHYFNSPQVMFPALIFQYLFNRFYIFISKTLSLIFLILGWMVRVQIVTSWSTWLNFSSILFLNSWQRSISCSFFTDWQLCVLGSRNSMIYSWEGVSYYWFYRWSQIWVIFKEPRSVRRRFDMGSGHYRLGYFWSKMLMSWSLLVISYCSQLSIAYSIFMLSLPRAQPRRVRNDLLEYSYDLFDSGSFEGYFESKFQRMACMSTRLLVVAEFCWEGLSTLMVLNRLNSESVPMEGVNGLMGFLLRSETVLNLALGHRFYLEALKGVELQLLILVFCI